jgi:hypothetical protein
MMLTLWIWFPGRSRPSGFPQSRADSAFMAHLSASWVQFMADIGNRPGAQQGDVLIELLSPVAGVQSITCPSSAVTIAAEAGQMVGLLVFQHGRRLFIPAANVGAVIDAPEPDQQPGHQQVS